MQLSPDLAPLLLFAIIQFFGYARQYAVIFMDGLRSRILTLSKTLASLRSREVLLS